MARLKDHEVMQKVGVTTASAMAVTSMTMGLGEVQASPAATFAAGSDGASCTLDSGAGCPADRFIKLRTEHEGRLLPDSFPAHVRETDLGIRIAVPTQRTDGQLGVRYKMLFGDMNNAGMRDPVAELTGFDDDGHPRIVLDRDARGDVQVLDPPGVDMGLMNVPTGGIGVIQSDGRQKTFIFVASGWDEAIHGYRTSAIVQAAGTDFSRLQTLSSVPSEKFINIDAVQEGDHVYLYGSGPYRESPIFMARASVDDVGNREAWEYYTGTDAQGVPQYSQGEASAVPFIDTQHTGELSVMKDPNGATWVMAGDDKGSERGIKLYRALHPAGPFSPPITIYDPAVDPGYGVFMHRMVTPDHPEDDHLGDPLSGHPNDWGGEYGAYFIPESFETLPNGSETFLFVMSTWNPYQPQLMRAYVGPEGTSYEPVERHPKKPVAQTDTRRDPPLAELRRRDPWSTPFFVEQRQDGSVRLRANGVGPHGERMGGAFVHGFTVPERKDGRPTYVSFGMTGIGGTVEVWDGKKMLHQGRGDASGQLVQRSWKLRPRDENGEPIQYRFIVRTDTGHRSGDLDVTQPRFESGAAP